MPRAKQALLGSSVGSWAHNLKKGALLSCKHTTGLHSLYDPLLVRMSRVHA